MFLTVPPPDRWQDFERLTLAVCARVWDSPDVESVGRPGQPQGGIDVVGYDYRRGDYWRIGVQCKRRDARQRDGAVATGGLLTIAQIKREVAKTRRVSPPLSQFVIATTAAQDVKLQQQVRAYSDGREKNGRSSVNIWFWEWFVDHLNRHVELLYTFYAELLRTSGAYNPDLHSVGLLRTAFDRPFLRTPFYSENSLTAVGDAIVRLQQVLSTGMLKDAEGATVGSAPPPRHLRSASDRAAIGLLQSELQAMRDVFTRAIRDGDIVQHSYMLEIRAPAIAAIMDSRRERLLAVLNDLLGRHGLEPIASPFAPGSHPHAV